MAISNPVVLDQNALGGPGSTASISPASGSLLLVFIELFSVPNTAITLSGQADGDGWTVVSDDFVVDRTRQVVLAAKASGATESISITTPGGLPCHYFVVSATLTGAFTASSVVAQSSFEADFTTTSGANLATAPTAMTLTMTSWGAGSPYTYENTQLGTPIEDTGTNRYIGLDYAASGDQQSTMTHDVDVAWRSTSIELVDSQVAGDLTASISQVGPYKAGDTLRIDLANATNASGKTAAIIDTATATGTTTINLAVTAQAIDYIDVTIPELHTVDGLLGKYGDTFTITVTDGSDTDTIDIPITEPDAHNAETVPFGEITALGGLFDGIPGVATGMHCYAEFLSGDSSIIFNAQTGSITEPNQDTQILVAIWDSNGVGSGTRTFLYQGPETILFNTPESRATLSGYNSSIDLRFEIVVGRILPIGGSNSAFGANTIMADNLFACRAQFGDKPDSGFFTTGTTIRVNDVEVTTASDIMNMVEDDILEVEVVASVNPGSLFMFADNGRTTFLPIAAKMIRIRDTSDTLLHEFDLVTVDFDTGAVTDSIGSATCVLEGFRAEINAIENGSIPATIKAGAQFTAKVDDAYKYDGLLVDGVECDNLTITDRQTLTANAPEDGFDPLNSNVLSLREANPLPVAKTLFDGFSGDLFMVNPDGQADTRYLYNATFAGARQPITTNQGPVRINGIMGRHKLLPESGTNTAIYRFGRIRADANAHIFHTAFNIDPNVQGVTLIYISRHKGLGGSNEPDFLWSGPFAVPEHGPIKLVLREGRTKMSWGVTNDAADEFELDTDTGDNVPYVYILTVDPATSTAIAYVNGVQDTSHSIVGTLLPLDDCSAVTGDRAGITHDFCGYGALDGVLTPAQVASLTTELRAAAVIDFIPSPTPLATPNITAQPANQLGINEGSDATFTISGTGYTSIQWYQKTSDGNVTELGTGTTQTITTALADTDSEVWAALTASNGTSTASSKAQLTVVDVDNVIPVITLLGDATVNLNVGDSYTEAGATATDDVDGDITANIVVSGDIVDTTTPGTYIIRFNVSDSSGNAAVEVTRSVIIAADTGAPVITLLGSATVNLEIGDSYTDAGATANDDVDGDITANIVVSGDTVDTNTDGTYVIRYNVSDAAGNAAVEVTRTVIVAADAVAPVITLLGDATVNLNVGDSYTDAGATATDNLDGDITANIVVSGDTVDVNTAATYTIRYNVSDSSGNPATEVIRTVIVAAAPAYDWRNSKIVAFDASQGDLYDIEPASVTNSSDNPISNGETVNEVTGIKGNIATGHATTIIQYQDNYLYSASGDGIWFQDMNPGPGEVDPETGPFTYACAFRLTGALAAAEQFIKTPASSGPIAGNPIVTMNTNNSVTFELTNFLQRHTTAALNLNQWYTVGVVWFQAAGAVRFYLDGVKVLEFLGVAGTAVKHFNGLQLTATNNGGELQIGRATWTKRNVFDNEMLGAHQDLIAGY